MVERRQVNVVLFRGDCLIKSLNDVVDLLYQKKSGTAFDKDGPAFLGKIL